MDRKELEEAMVKTNPFCIWKEPDEKIWFDKIKYLNVLLQQDIKKLQQELADTKKKLEHFKESRKKWMTEAFVVWDELEAFKKEALEVISLIAGHSANACPVAVGFHEEACDCGYTEVNKFLQKHTKNIGDETKKISEQTKMEG